MKKLLWSMIVGLGLALFMAPEATASDPFPNERVENFVTARGYTYHNGLWYIGNQAYTRAKVYFTNYYTDNYGCRVAYQDWRIDYTPYVDPYVAPVTNTTVYDDNFDSKFLDIVSRNQRDESSRQQLALRYAKNTQLLELGVTHRLLTPVQAQQIAYPMANHYGSLFQGGYGAGYAGAIPTGNTLYGYSYNQVKDLYGDTSMNVLYQQAARGRDQAQIYGNEADTRFSGLVGQAASGVANQSEIQTKALAFVSAVNAAAQVLKAEPSARVTTTINGTGQTPVQLQTVQTAQQFTTATAPVMPLAVDDALPLATLFTQDCASCHAGATPKAAFTLTKLVQGGDAAVDLTASRLMTKDPDKVMPKGGHGLSVDRLSQWLKELAKLKKGGQQ